MGKTTRKIKQKIDNINYILLPGLRNMRKLNRLVYVQSSNGRIYMRNRVDECRGDGGYFHYAKKTIEDYKREKSNLRNKLDYYNSLKDKINGFPKSSYRWQRLVEKRKTFEREVQEMSMYGVE